MPTILGQKRGQRGQYKTVDGQLVNSFPIVFWVQADSPTQTQGEILQTPGLPVVNLTLVADSGITTICKSKSAEQSTESSLRWTVTCEFDNEPVKQNENQGGSEGTQGSDPTTWIPIAEVKYESMEVPSYRDTAGTVIKTSAGEVFDQPLNKPIGVGILEFTQYESPSQNAYDFMDRTNVLNGSTFLGKSAKTWLCSVKNATLGYKNGVRVWKVDYQLKYRSDTWQEIRLDQGSFYKSGTNTLRFRDAEKNIIPLGNLNAGTNNGTTPVTLGFDVYATNSFSFVRVS
jgi:hypothetical protein